MEQLREQLDTPLFYALDEAIGELVRAETEAAYALGQAVAEQQQEEGDILTWAAEFEREADSRGVRLSERGRQREGVPTLEDLAQEFGVTARTARRRLRQARSLGELVERSGRRGSH